MGNWFIFIPKSMEFLTILAFKNKKTTALRIPTPQRPGYFEDPAKTPLVKKQGQTHPFIWRFQSLILRNLKQT